MSRKNKIKELSNQLADQRDFWIKKNAFFYRNDTNYMKFLSVSNAKIMELGCGTGDLLNSLSPSYGLGIDFSDKMIEIAKNKYPDLDFIIGDVEDDSIFNDLSQKFDYIILSDLIGSIEDIQGLLKKLKQVCHEDTKLIIAYYSWRWRPILKIGEKFGQKMPSMTDNWLSTDDTINFLELADYEFIKREWRQILPKKIFGLGNLVNNFIGTLPFIRRLSLRNYIVAKPILKKVRKSLSTSILIPCRNEEGNIENAVKRIPKFCKDMEIIFVEGGSSDNTVEMIAQIIKKYPKLDIKFYKQDGKGKGDAVRKGFSMASGEVLMILDADLTVPPEDLPKFYEAIVAGKGDFINGSRLVYPMHNQAMRFLNFWANRTFSVIFTWLLNQRITDTLCGTKVLKKKHYEKILENKSYFGDFDPFGDFDLIFGAAKLNLKIIDLPIRYDERKYGETQISRFSHGFMLLKMVLFAFKKLKFHK